MNELVFKLSTVLIFVVSCTSLNPEMLIESPVEISNSATGTVEVQLTSTIISTQIYAPPVVTPVTFSTTTIQPIATASRVSTQEPTITIIPNEPTIEGSTEVVFGRTLEGVFFYGSPSAEIVLINYSEFL